MNRAQKRALRAQRSERRRQLRARRAELQSQLRAARARRPRRRWRRWRWALLLLLLLFLLRDCCCEEATGPTAPAVPAPPPAVTTATVVEPPPPPPPPVKARLRRRRRPALQAPKPPPRTWLDDFRLQVAARSVRLAACFEGIDRPGAVRWSCALDPASGKVSDQRFEPIASRTGLTPKQQRCLRKALAKPVYRLKVADDGATPDRVSLVLEF